LVLLKIEFMLGLHNLMLVVRLREARLQSRIAFDIDTDEGIGARRMESGEWRAEKERA